MQSRASRRVWKRVSVCDLSTFTAITREMNGSGSRLWTSSRSMGRRGGWHNSQQLRQQLSKNLVEGAQKAEGQACSHNARHLNGGRIRPSNLPVTPPNSTGGLWERFQHPNFAPTLPPKEETDKLLPAFVFVSGLPPDTDAIKTVPTVRPCWDWYLSGSGSATVVPEKKGYWHGAQSQVRAPPE